MELYDSPTSVRMTPQSVFHAKLEICVPDCAQNNQIFTGSMIGSSKSSGHVNC